MHTSSYEGEPAGRGRSGARGGGSNGGGDEPRRGGAREGSRGWRERRKGVLKLVESRGV